MAKRNEPISGNTRLDKLVFLIEMETSLGKLLKNDFKYEAYNFGPYSSEVFDAIQALNNAGLVNIDRKPVDELLSEADRYYVEQQADIGESQEAMAVYSLTEDGITVAESLFNSLSDNEKKELVSLKEKYNAIDLHALIRYVYKKYPDYAAQSLIRDKF